MDFDEFDDVEIDDMDDFMAFDQFHLRDLGKFREQLEINLS